MGKGRSSSSSGWRAPQRGIITSFVYFARFIIISQDRPGNGDGNLIGKLPIRLYHCPNSRWELPSRSRAIVDEHQPSAYGVQRPECADTSETRVNVKTRAARDLN